MERRLKIVLVPGLFASISSLASLRTRLEDEGYECVWPGFDSNTFVHGELDTLARTVRGLGECIVIGHSMGGLYAVTLALADNPHIKLVVGLGTPMWGHQRPRVPYHEGRSWTDGLLPLTGPTSIRRFNTLHVLLPFDPNVQQWIVETLDKELAE